MIRVEYSKAFLKDLKKMSRTVFYAEVKHLCLTVIPEKNNFTEINGLKKIEGHKNYFRIRISDYRVGNKN